MTQNDNFFIFDCNGDIVGNPNGYKTMSAALTQQNRAGSPAYKAIWAAYDARAAAGSERLNICKIAHKAPIERIPLIQAARMLGALQIINI